MLQPRNQSKETIVASDIYTRGASVGQRVPHFPQLPLFPFRLPFAMIVSPCFHFLRDHLLIPFRRVSLRNARLSSFSMVQAFCWSLRASFFSLVHTSVAKYTSRYSLGSSACQFRKYSLYFAYHAWSSTCDAGAFHAWSFSLFRWFIRSRYVERRSARRAGSMPGRRPSRSTS